MRSRHSDIDRQILEELIALLLRLAVMTHVVRRVLLVVRLIILLD